MNQFIAIFVLEIQILEKTYNNLYSNHDNKEIFTTMFAYYHF